MNQQILHDGWEEKIMARVTGELSAEESTLFDQHIESCASCAQELREYDFLARRLHSVENDIVVPALSPALLTLQQEIAQYRLQEEARQIIEQTFVYVSKKHAVEEAHGELVELAQAVNTKEIESLTTPPLSRSPFDDVHLVEEARLVQRAMESDARAFEALYEACLEPVYRYIYRRVENVFEAETLTSETFTRAVDLLAQGRYDWIGKPFRAWLIGIAAKILQERYRVLKNDPAVEGLSAVLERNELVSGENDVLDFIVQQEERSALWQLVEQLPLVERSVVILRHVYELPYARIAERLERSEDACKQIYYRALKRLRLKALEAGL